MTGFSDTERALGRLVSLAVSKGVPESAFGLGGMRTVGPCVTLQGGAQIGYRINGERGVFLGRTSAAARNTVRAIYRQHAATVSPATVEG